MRDANKRSAFYRLLGIVCRVNQTYRAGIGLLPKRSASRRGAWDEVAFAARRTETVRLRFLGGRRRAMLGNFCICASRFLREAFRCGRRDGRDICGASEFGECLAWSAALFAGMGRISTCTGATPEREGAAVVLDQEPKKRSTEPPQRAGTIKG